MIRGMLRKFEFMEESNQLIKNYIEYVKVSVQYENKNDNDDNDDTDSSISQFEEREYQCGCLVGGVLKMLSYFKLMNRYYHLHNDNYNNKNNQINYLDPKDIDKLNIANVNIIENDDSDPRIKKSFCKIDFSF